MDFERIAILGCGLMGGSLALGLKRNGYSGEIVAWDREKTLEKAKQRGAIDRGTASVSEAVAGADMVYLATPVMSTLELLPQVGQHAKPGALVTDAGSTKVRICDLARRALPEHVVFLGGHPMAGREVGGIENADPDLFVGSKYLLVRGASKEEEDKTAAVEAFLGWVRRLGAEPVFLDAATHDWAVALISQAPQLLSTALASSVWDETDDDGLPLRLAGRGFCEMTRLAASPYDIWRDICLTNSDNLERALERLEQRLAYLRTHLRSPELGEVFEKARSTCATLKAAGRSETDK